MFEQKASDLHLSTGNPPILRINGNLRKVDYPPLESDMLQEMLYEITPEYKRNEFEEHGDHHLPLCVKVAGGIGFGCAPQHKQIMHDGLEGWDGCNTIRPVGVAEVFQGVNSKI